MIPDDLKWAQKFQPKEKKMPQERTATVFLLLKGSNHQPMV
jgi:hypothetical protein